MNYLLVILLSLFAVDAVVADDGTVAAHLRRSASVGPYFRIQLMTTPPLLLTIADEKQRTRLVEVVNDRLNLKSEAVKSSVKDVSPSMTEAEAKKSYRA